MPRQLAPNNYDVKNLRFGKIAKRTSASGVQYIVIPIKTVYNKDGKTGDLLFATGRVRSFGFRENHNGYSLSLSLYDSDNLHAWQKPLCESIERVARIADSEVQRLGLFDRVTDSSPLYTGDEGPVLYPRVIMSKRGAVFSNLHRKSLDEKVVLEEVLDKRFDARAVVKIDGVYVGESVRLQISLIEAELVDREEVIENLLEPEE